MLISLRLDGADRDREVEEAELSDALGRVLPSHGCDVMLSFIKVRRLRRLISFE